MIWLGPEYENGGWLQTPTGGKKRFGVIIPAVISGSLRGSRRSPPITEGCRSGLTDCTTGVLPMDGPQGLECSNRSPSASMESKPDGLSGAAC